MGALPGVVLLYLRWNLYREIRSEGNIGEIERSISRPALGATEDNSSGDYIRLDGSSETDSENHQKERAVGDFNNKSNEAVPNQRESLWTAIKREPNLFRKVCGTAGSWFLFDIVFYGNTLFQPIVLENAFRHSSRQESDDADQSTHEFHLLLQTVRDSMFLSLIALPGYITAVYLIGRPTCSFVQTLRYIQIQGFLFMAILYAVIAIYWEELKQIQWLLVTLYGSTFFFANYGPNTTTFILPSISYSSQCRSTLNGISAACGKVGALIGASMFEPVANYYGDSEVMFLCACTSVLACFVTVFCVYV